MRLEILLLVGLVVLASGCTSDQPETDSSPDADVDQQQPEDQQENDQNQDTQDTSDQTQNEGDTQQVNTENNIIYYTDSGFVPQTLNVGLGEEVTWINNASSPMWVASNEHPWHTNYAGDNLREHCTNGEPTNDQKFDQCSNGNRYTFAFEKTGEWGYHNHEASSDKGTIIVG